MNKHALFACTAAAVTLPVGFIAAYLASATPHAAAPAANAALPVPPLPPSGDAPAVVDAANAFLSTLSQQQKTNNERAERDTMNEQTLGDYEHYINQTFAVEDEGLRTAWEEMQREGLPEINVSASEGKLLHVLALMSGARRILEVGTLGGYSTIWLARALPPDGRLISLELDPHHAEVAQRSIARAGLAGKVEVRVGPALASLSQMEADGEAPFDLAFIDADKDGYVEYLKKAVVLVRDGGLILGDNTLPDAVLDPAADSGTKRYNTAVAAHPDLISIIFPVLRERGVDGLLVSIKREKR